MTDDPPQPPEQPPPAGDPPGGADYFPGEKNRRVPRAAWWVLAAACVLLLVFLVIRPEWFTRNPDDTSLHVPADRHFSKTVAELGHSDGLWLNDDAPTTSFTVTMPVDSTRSSTRIHLRGDTQVAQDSTAFLSVTADGTQVYRSELPRGDNSLDAIVDLPDSTADDGRVRLQIRTDGSLHNQTCATDHSPGLNVHVAPDTVVEAALDQPVHTVRDVVASWSRHIRVLLADQEDQWRTAAAQLGIALTQAGYGVTYTGTLPDDDGDDVVLVGNADELSRIGWKTDSADPAAVGSVGDSRLLGIRSPTPAAVMQFLTSPAVSVNDTAGSDPRQVPVAKPTGNDVALGDLGADLSPTTITENHSWRASYALADLPGGRLPQAIRSTWQLPAGPDDLNWILNVTLNGQLIDSKRLAGGTPTVTTPLPASAQRVDNSLTLMVQRDRDIGGCDVRVTPYSIALQPTSILQLGNDPGAGFTSLPRILSPGFAVYVTATAPEGSIDTLNSTIPIIAEFVPAQMLPNFIWGAASPPDKPFVLLGSAPGIGTAASLTNGRLITGAPPALDTNAFSNGAVVACGTVGNEIRGLVVQWAGTLGDSLGAPSFGNEAAQVITAHGGFAVNAAGVPVSTGQSRNAAPG